MASYVDELNSLLEFSKRNAKEYLAVAALFLVISFLVFWPAALSPASVVVNGTSDLFQSLWNLWWVNYAIFTLHTSPYFTNMLYFPVGANLATQTMTPLAAILTLPFQLVSLALAYNVIFFLGFALSGFFMYLLANHFLKNKFASFIAGAIYAFSPMHIAQAFGHLNWTSIEFVPIFLLFFILMIKEKRIKYALGAAVSFVFLLFIGDIQMGLIVAFLSLVLLVISVLGEGRKDVLSTKFAASLAALAVMTLIIGAPFFIWISGSLLGGGSLNQTAQQNTAQYNMLWSDPVQSFFLPSPYNNFFSPISSAYYSIYAADPTERVSYIGYVALALSLFAVYNDFKKKKMERVWLWIILALFFGWLSLGPYLQLSSPTGGVAAPGGIPGIYLAYHAIPLLNIVREPGRFDLVFTLALAMLAGYGFKDLVEHMKLKKPQMLRMEEYLTVALVALIIIEYAGVPVGHQFISGAFTRLSIPAAYYQIGNVTGNFSVLTLPSLPVASQAPELFPAMAMYYQTAFHKPLLNGYTTRVNQTEQLPAMSIPLSISASYLQEGQGLVYPYPILENYTQLNLFWLTYYKVGFVSIMRSAFTANQTGLLAGYLYSFLGQPLYQDNTTVVFAASNSPYLNNALSNNIAYTAGTWTPGWVICQNYGLQCNATSGSLWWGANVRAIDIFAPPNKTNVTMFFTAQSYPQVLPLSIYLNSPNSRVASFNLTQNVSVYRLDLKLSQGINQLFLASPSSPGAASNPYLAYLNFGMENVTIQSS